jgi:hypothetical protein
LGHLCQKAVRNTTAGAGEERSTGTASDKAEIFAQAQGSYTLIERSTTAAEQALEKSFEAQRTGDVFFDLGELSRCEFLPTRADARIVAEAAEEELDFDEGEAHFARKANEQDAIEGVRGIATLAAGTVRWNEQAEFLVVANGGSVQARAASEFPDFH